jgi:hypothetical protein
MAANVTTGRNGIEQGKVLILAAEDAFEEDIKPKIMAAGGDVSQVDLLNVELGDTQLEQELKQLLGDVRMRLPLKFPRDTTLLASEIVATGAKLVIIDPLSAFLGDGLKTDKPEDMGKVFYPLAAVAAATGCVIVIVDHTGKSDRDDLVDKILGSVQKVNAVRSALVMVKSHEQGDDVRLLFHEKHNKSEGAPTLVIFLEGTTITDDGVEVQTVIAKDGGTTDKTWADVKAENRKAEKPGGKARDWLETKLAFLKEVDVHELRLEVEPEGESGPKPLGFSWKTVQRTSREMGLKRATVGVKGQGNGTRTVWRKR